MSGFTFDHMPEAERPVAALMDLRAWRRHCTELYMNPSEIAALDMAIAALAERSSQ